MPPEQVNNPVFTPKIISQEETRPGLPRIQWRPLPFLVVIFLLISTIGVALQLLNPEVFLKLDAPSIERKRKHQNL